MLAISFIMYILLIVGTSIGLFVAIQKEKVSQKEKIQMLITYGMFLIFGSLVFFQTFFRIGWLEEVRNLLVNGNGFIAGELMYVVYISLGFICIVVGFLKSSVLRASMGLLFVHAVVFMPFILTSDVVDFLLP